MSGEDAAEWMASTMTLEIWTVPVEAGQTVTVLTPDDETVTIEPTEITSTSRPSGTVHATAHAADGTQVLVTVSYLDGGWFTCYPMAPRWIIDRWMTTSQHPPRRGAPGHATPHPGQC